MIRRPPRSTLFPTRRSSDLAGIDLDAEPLGLLSQPAANVAEADDVVPPVPEAFGQEKIRHPERSGPGEKKKPVLAHRGRERSAAGLPVGEELLERARVHHGAGQDVRPDLRALLDHANAQCERVLRRELLQADRARESCRPAAHHDHIELNRFARHDSPDPDQARSAANYNVQTTRREEAAMAEAPLWKPSTERIEEANLTRFARQAIRDWKLGLNDYPAFYRWTIDRPEQFWDSLWKFASVRASAKGSQVLVNGDRMPGALWYPEARLNFAENLLRRRDASTAMVFWGEDKVKRRVTHRELSEQVSQVAQGLRDSGVRPGDRVAAYLPNLPEAIAAMLAATSIGATFSTCSPDFGVQGVLDRFGQIAPSVLFAADGYYYNGKQIDSLQKVREIAARLPSLRRVVVVPYVSDRPDVSAIPGAQRLQDFLAGRPASDIPFEQLPFDHPLYILYSSGTTGAPKCIVHGAGGALLKHLCEQQLHCDVKPGDRLFYFTTLGWMMWNWLASWLASGATLLLYDRSPLVQDRSHLFDYAHAQGKNQLGTSAEFIDAIAKAGVGPG